MAMDFSSSDEGRPLNEKGLGSSRPRRFYRWAWAVCSLAALSLLPVLLSPKGVRTENKSKTQNWEEKQELPEVTSQGGTLESGPGCPSVCGSFVACELNVSSRNNLLPLESWKTCGKKWLSFI